MGYVSKEDYRTVIDGVIEFLGKADPIVRALESKMRQAAEEERFEEAARYRNRLFSVRHWPSDRRPTSAPWARST